MEEEKCFRYLRVNLAADGTMEVKVSHGVGERE